jgi:hypothetical protein
VRFFTVAAILLLVRGATLLLIGLDSFLTDSGNKLSLNLMKRHGKFGRTIPPVIHILRE